MSGDVARDTDPIQLNFCQRCGISIPLADIESGRAHAAPGGFVCAGCTYQERDETLAPVASSPVPSARRARPAGEANGSRALVAIALLYVVGATTFLLFRELNRREPRLTLPPTVASTRDLLDIDRKLSAVDSTSRRALAQLYSSVSDQAESLQRVDANLVAVEKFITERDEQAVMRDQELRKGLLELTQRTLGLTRDASSILEEIKRLEGKVGSAGAQPAGGPTVKKEPADEPGPRTNEPAATEEDLERKRLVQEYIAKLQDKKASNTARYNAAVQLGDLKHADACDPLITALQDDPFDLARRAAAWSLGMLGKHAVKSIPVLIEQIGKREEYVGYMCERALGEITKATTGAAVSFNFDPTMSQRDRRKVQRKWEAWWRKHRSQLLPS